MSNDTVSQILIIVLGIMIFILIILSITFLVLKTKEKKKEKKVKKEIKSKDKSKEKKNVDYSYNKQSIMDFMEFDKIEDSMIVQKGGKRFLMAVECQGVNYDLMSKIEKVAVEEGFQQFLNTLRHPIQIYIQTRTINLEGSIGAYKDKVKVIEDKYNRMQQNYKEMRESREYTEQQMQKFYFELTKQRNLLEYGKDLIANTEKMSLNRSVLNKRYYIILPYFVEEDESKYDAEEIKNRAFSELYTKAQSIIRTLSACSVAGKILNSRELVELLYVAYNRDESEVFGIDKAMKAGYDGLYSVAPDVYEKKIKVLDNMIKERAVKVANEAINKVKSEKQKEAEDKDANMKELVRKMAQLVLEENIQYVGADIAQKAIQEIENNKEGGEENYEENKKENGRGKRTTIK